MERENGRLNGEREGDEIKGRGGLEGSVKRVVIMREGRRVDRERGMGEEQGRG